MKVVSLATRLASESKPTLTMPRKRLPLASPTSIRRVSPAARTATAPAGSSGMPSTRARSLPRPPGMIAQRRLGARHRPADGAEQAVAAAARPAARRASTALQRPLDAVLQALGPLDAKGDPPLVQLLLDPGQQLQHAPVRGVRVDQQRQRQSLGLPSSRQPRWTARVGRRRRGGRRRSCRSRRAVCTAAKPAGEPAGKRPESWP